MRNRSTASFRDIEMPSRSSFSSDNVETRRRLTALFRFSDSHGVSEHASEQSLGSPTSHTLTSTKDGDGGRDPADGSACPPFTETEIDNIIKSINMAHAHHADAAAGSVAFKSTLRTLGQKLAAIDLYMRRQNDRLDGQIRANRRLVVTNEQLSTTIDTLSKDIQSKDLTIERLNRFMDD